MFGGKNAYKNSISTIIIMYDVVNIPSTYGPGLQYTMYKTLYLYRYSSTESIIIADLYIHV